MNQPSIPSSAFGDETALKAFGLPLYYLHFFLWTRESFRFGHIFSLERTTLAYPLVALGHAIRVDPSSADVDHWFFWALFGEGWKHGEAGCI
jgi:hypothetical protein